MEARYGKGKTHYPGTISGVNGDGTYNILYDDGGKEAGVTADLIRALKDESGGGGSDSTKKKKQKPPDGGRGGGGEFTNGSKVEARYRKGKKVYAGTSTRVGEDGTYDIMYDDGEGEIAVPAGMIRSKESKKDGDGTKAAPAE